MRQIREIRVKDLVLYFWVQIAVIAAIWTAYGILAAHRVFNMKTIYLLLIALALNYLPTRWFIIGCVLMYKAYAPMEVRDRCRFVPTCSTYMIMAIQKYGVIIGLIKGIRRLLRCKPPNGGVDYP